MAAPIAAFQSPELISTDGDKYVEVVTYTMDSVTNFATLLASSLTRVKAIEEVIGCPAVIAAGGVSAALTGLPLSSTLRIRVKGRAGA